MNAFKRIMTAATAAVCVLGMAACGNGNGSASGTTDMTYPSIELGKTKTDIKATIRVFNHKTDMANDSYNGESWNEYIAAFNKLYPNITVKVETSTNYASDALTRLQGGDWGDVMMLPAVDRSEYPTYFLPFGSLDDMKKEVRYATNNAYEKKVYGIASMGNALGVVYNKKIFQEAGVTEVPKTPDDFIAALKAVKEKTKAIPLYTNYAAGWTMSAWDAYIGGTATGDNKYMNQELLHTESPFADPGDGTHAYNVYKVLYDAVADGLIEDDYSTTDWESSKSKMNNGEIATMVLGAWAVSQIKNAGSNADDISYMPFPITVDGKQYTTSTADYAWCINKDSSVTNQEAAMIFVKWMVEKSGFAINEGGIPTDISDDSMPDIYGDEFKDVDFIEDEPAVDGEEDLFNDLNSDSELAINAGGNARVQAIVEHAANKDESYDDIVKEWNEKWNAALKTEDVDVKYTTVVK